MAITIIPASLGGTGSTNGITPTAISDQNNSSTGYLDLPTGTTAQRPVTPVEGMVRYNSETYSLETYMRGSWIVVGSNPVIPVNKFGFTNRIINGNMVIDQRNAGVSVTQTSVGYTLDRWQSVMSVGSKFSVQKNAASVTPPAGFSSYLGVTSTSAYSVAATDYFDITQNIEGYNWADLGFGTANASSVTFSFWVRSSLTGLFSGTLINSNDSQVYPFSYTISVANTWEQKSVTIAGSTSGTWNTTNGIGAKIQFCLGIGTNFLGTLNNTWNAGTLYGPIGQVNLVATNGATFYVTGVQLEKGTVATSFDNRPYGTELMLCQRYFANLLLSGTDYNIGVTRDSSTASQFVLYAPVTMRATPTLGVPSGFGRVVAYDTSFGITVNSVTAMALSYAADNRILNIYMSTASYGGSYVYSAYDTIGATTAMTISSEL